MKKEVKQLFNDMREDYAKEFVDSQETAYKDKVDPRLEQYGRPKTKTTKCRVCDATCDKDFRNCWLCLNYLHGITSPSLTIRHKINGRYFSSARLNELEHQGRKHAKDLVQPYKYDTISKKQVPNKDYIKLYGTKDYADKSELKNAS